MSNKRDALIQKIRDGWPAKSDTYYPARGRFWAAPPVRDGGVTAALIDFAADTAVEVFTPRTISTFEELDEAILSAFEDAAHIVLSDHKGRPWIIWSDEDGDEVVNSWPQDGDPKRLKLGDIALPATVLSHPAA